MVDSGAGPGDPGGDDTETLAAAAPPAATPTRAVREVFEPEEVVAGRFRIARLIRQGGMGQVYEAEDLELGQRVALKTLRPELAADERLVARFKEEIGLARRVTHPNACRAFDLFRHRGEAGEDVLFISMEYLPGRPLDRALAERGALPAAHALAIARQVVEGLEAAHRAGVLHRDLKPGNVLLVPAQDGVRAVVTDFGLAEAIASQAPDKPRAGTPSHMAPEQRDGRGASPRSDVYALGLLLFEMRTGRLPQPGEIDSAATRRRLGRTWAAVIRRCLAHEPEERFPSPQAVIERLDPARREWRGGRRLLPWAAALAVAVGVAVALHNGLAERRDRGGAPPVEPLPRPSAAILPFTSTGSDQAWLAEALPQMLQAHLAAGDSVRLVPARYVADLGRNASRDPAALGRTLGVRWLVTGSYAVRDAPGGAVLEVKVRSLVIGEGGTEETFTESQPLAQLFGLVARIAARLRESLRVGQLSPVELAALRGSLPEDLAAFRLYSEGLLALDRHRPDQARVLLERSVAAAPAYPLARDALADALDRLGYSRDAAREAGEAFRLSTGSLPPAEALRIEARYRELSHQWDQAIAAWQALRTVFPDRPEYVFGLAQTQASAGRPAAALETLEALAKAGGDNGHDPRLDLAEAAARRLLGDFPEAIRSAAAAEEKAAAEGLPALALEASLERAYALRESGELDQAETLYRAALTTLEDWDDPGRVAEVTQELGVVASYRSDYQQTRRLYERALAAYRRIGDAAGTGTVLSSLGLTLAELGDLPGADRALAEAVGILRGLGRPQLLGSALANQGGIAEERGDLERAEIIYGEAVSLTRETGSRNVLAANLTNLCAVYLGRGDTAAARKAVEEAYQLSQEMESDMGQAITLITLSSVDYDDLRLAAARQRLEEARGLAAKAGLEWLLGHIDEGLGKVAREDGDLAEARSRFEASLERRKALGESLELSPSHCALADLALAESKPDEAAEWARRCLTESQGLGKAAEVPEAGALLVEALVGSGHREAAEEVATTAVRPAVGSPYLAVRVAAVRVEALLAAARGDREGAAGSLRALLETGDLAHGPARLRRRTRLLLERFTTGGPARARSSRGKAAVPDRPGRRLGSRPR